MSESLANAIRELSFSTLMVAIFTLSPLWSMRLLLQGLLLPADRKARLKFTMAELGLLFFYIAVGGALANAAVGEAWTHYQTKEDAWNNAWEAGAMVLMMVIPWLFTLALLRRYRIEEFRSRLIVYGMLPVSSIVASLMISSSCLTVYSLSVGLWDGDSWFDLQSIISRVVNVLGLLLAVGATWCMRQVFARYVKQEHDEVPPDERKWDWIDTTT